MHPHRPNHFTNTIPGLPKLVSNTLVVSKTTNGKYEVVLLDHVPSLKPYQQRQRNN